MIPLFTKRDDLGENVHIAMEFLPASPDQSPRHGAWVLNGGTPYLRTLALTYLSISPARHARHLDAEGLCRQQLVAPKVRQVVDELSRVHLQAAQSTLKHREVSSQSRMDQLFFADCFDAERIMLLEIVRGGEKPTDVAMELLELFHKEVGKLTVWSNLIRTRHGWKAHVKCRAAADLSGAVLWVFVEVIATGVTTSTAILRQLQRCRGMPRQIVISSFNACREGITRICHTLGNEGLQQPTIFVGMLHGGLDERTGMLINPGVGKPSEVLHSRLPSRVDRSNGENAKSSA